VNYSCAHHAVSYVQFQPENSPHALCMPACNDGMCIAKR